MWVPRSAAELIAALEGGGLEETAYLDGKARIPDPRANVELAVDICAMTVEGGVLLIGAGENDDKTRLVRPEPIELAGARERVTQIAGTAISEPPVFDVRNLPIDDDPSRGFLVVLVPPSPRAPHQVISRDHGDKYYGRYYGREATGNRILSQREVDALYSRRTAAAGSDVRAEAKELLRKRSAAAYSAGGRCGL